MIERLQRRSPPIAGITVYFQPVQDIQISHPGSRAQYQYTLVGTDAAELRRGPSSWSKLRAPRCATSPSEPQDGGCAS